jgi:predicted TIM-barrel fold metal-dependent hydrolase
VTFSVAADPRSDSMGMPTNQPVIDTMIGFPMRDVSKTYAFITNQVKDKESKEEFSFPAQYMFKDVPHEFHGTEDPISITLEQMDKYNIQYGMIGVGEEDGDGERALKLYPNRFIPSLSIDANDGVAAQQAMVKNYELHGIRSVTLFPAGMFPQVPINDKKMYPIYAKACELDIPVFVCAGIPGPRLKFAPQHVELIDEVMYDFPELTFVTRHGCQPWTELAVKLMLKWPGLHYSTSAFAPKHYDKNIINYANTRGADKIIYAGYYPMGLSMERIMTDMPAVPFKDEVWPKFLYGNAARILKIDA